MSQALLACLFCAVQHHLTDSDINCGHGGEFVEGRAKEELLSNCDTVVLLTFVGEFTYSSSSEAGAAQAESI